MTEIRIDHEHLAIEADGHAHEGQDAQGYDEVCCAVSTIMQTLLYAARRMGNRMEHEIREGYLAVRYAGRTPSRELLGAFRAAAYGMEMLQAAYPRNIRIR